MTAKFNLGRTIITRNALDALHPEDVPTSILRHASGDWGEVNDGDKLANDHALKDCTRLLSAYTDRNGVKFWIITEADRSATTVLLPEDY